MKKLLVSVNSKYIHSALAVWYLKAVAEDCAVFECTINQDPQVVLQDIIKEKPGFIGFSCYIWNIQYVCTLVPLLRAALPQVVIALGGPEVSYNPSEYKDVADYVLCGYGESVFKELIQCVEGGVPCKKVLYGVAGVVPPSPYTKEYLAALGGRLAYLETSRGCPFSCGFCLSGIEEQPLYFPLDRAKEDILTLAKSGATTVKLVDRTFNANPQRAYDLWHFILTSPEIPKHIRFHFEIGADLLTDAQFTLLKTAPVGRFQFEIGLQSWNADTLNCVQRKTNMDKLAANITSLMEMGNIHVHLDLIVGLPFEGVQGFAKSFNQTYNFMPHMLQVGFLKLLHGSQLRADAAKYNMVFSHTPPYEIKELSGLSASQVNQLHRFEDIVERVYNSGRFTRTIKYLLEATGLTPFELFMDTAGIQYQKRCSLDQFTADFFHHWTPRVDKGILRDILVWDRLESNNTGHIPAILQVADPQFGKLRRAYHGQVGLAILYTFNKALVVPYNQADPITGRYRGELTHI